MRLEPVPSRAQAARRHARAVVLGFAATAAILVAISLPTTRGRPLGYVVALVIAWLPIALLATWAAVGRGGSMLGRPARWLVATSLLTPVVLLLSWIPVTLRWPETLVDVSGAFEHGRCIAATVGFAVGPFVAFMLIRRASDPVNPVLTGAAIGTAAATWGAVTLPLICGFTAPRHMLIGHLLPVLLIAAVGAALGGRLVAVRPKTE